MKSFGLLGEVNIGRTEENKRKTKMEEIWLITEENERKTKMDEKLKLALEAVAVKFSETTMKTDEAHWKAVREYQEVFHQHLKICYG